ncbi:exo-alpha-sialidase [Arcanobacterium wilhelmae]|uniref:exo-alpha-sialidase n=1 Tax=Arcanobacterium wilhelmae TaxID=1803177 RepID=UPI0027D7DB9D|nr:exo-alpha-sialidase [Arcanobacterium wilhelmae]
MGWKAFKSEVTVDSTFYRIPFLLETKSGVLVAGTDANRGTTGDSADNIDAAIRRRLPSGEWEAAQVPAALDLRDYSENSGYARASASVIDGIIMQDSSSNQLKVLIDLWPWNGGVFTKLNVWNDGSVHGGDPRSFVLGDGFASVAGHEMLLLSSKNRKGDANGEKGVINLNTNRADFDYVADVDGPRDSDGRIRVYHLEGQPRQYTAQGVDDSNLLLGAESEYSLSSDFELYKYGKQLNSHQVDTGKVVPMKIMYRDSELQMFNTQHILQVSSSDDGKTWKTDGLKTRDFRSPDSKYSLIAPGKAVQTRAGVHPGRLIVSVYTQKAGGTFAESVYSDDGGLNWNRGGDIPNNANLHESTIVELSGGTLLSFNRNPGNNGKVLWSYSADGAMTWSAPQSAFGDSAQGVASQVSAVALSKNLKSKKTGEELPTIAVLTPTERDRTHGVVHFGVVHNSETRPEIEWVGTTEITAAGKKFGYSSIEQLKNGKIGVLYEASPTGSWADGLKSIYYREIAATPAVK